MKLQINPPLATYQSGELIQFNGITILLDGVELHNVVSRVLMINNDIVTVTITQQPGGEYPTVRKFYLKNMSQLNFEVVEIKE